MKKPKKWNNFSTPQTEMRLVSNFMNSKVYKNTLKLSSFETFVRIVSQDLLRERVNPVFFGEYFGALFFEGFENFMYHWDKNSPAPVASIEHFKNDGTWRQHIEEMEEILKTQSEPYFQKVAILENISEKVLEQYYKCIPELHKANNELLKIFDNHPIAKKRVQRQKNKINDWKKTVDNFGPIAILRASVDQPYVQEVLNLHNENKIAEIKMPIEESSEIFEEGFEDILNFMFPAEEIIKEQIQAYEDNERMKQEKKASKKLMKVQQTTNIPKKTERTKTDESLQSNTLSPEKKEFYFAGKQFERVKNILKTSKDAEWTQKQQEEIEKIKNHIQSSTTTNPETIEIYKKTIELLKSL